MARQKVTLYLDPVVLRRMRVAAAREGKKDSEFAEEAIKEALGMAVLERVWAQNTDLSEEEAMALALEAQHAVRQQRH